MSATGSTHLAQVLDARRAAFDARCTEVTRKWKTAASEPPPSLPDVDLQLATIATYCNSAQTASSDSDNIERAHLLSSAVSPTSNDERALPSHHGDDAESTETDVEPTATSKEPIERVERELVDFEVLMELHATIDKMSADLDAPLSLPSGLSEGAADAPAPPLPRSTTPSMWTGGGTAVSSSTLSERSAAATTKSSTAAEVGAAPRVPTESRAAQMTRSLLDRLQRLHAAQESQRRLLKQGYQQTVTALSRMHSAALCEATANAQRRVAELVMAQQKVTELSSDAEAKVRRMVDERTMALGTARDAAQARLARLEVDHAATLEQLHVESTAKHEALARAERAHADCLAAEEYAEFRARMKLEAEREAADERRRCEGVVEREAARDAAEAAAAKRADMSAQLEATEGALADCQRELSELRRVSERDVEKARRVESLALEQLDAGLSRAAEDVATADGRMAEAEARAAGAEEAAEAKAAVEVEAARADAAAAHEAREAAVREQVAAEMAAEEQRVAHAHQLAVERHAAAESLEEAEAKAKAAEAKAADAEAKAAEAKAKAAEAEARAAASPPAPRPSDGVAPVASSTLPTATADADGDWEALFSGQLRPEGGWQAALGPPPTAALSTDTAACRSGGDQLDTSAASHSREEARAAAVLDVLGVPTTTLRVHSSSSTAPAHPTTAADGEPLDSMSSRLEALLQIGSRAAANANAIATPTSAAPAAVTAATFAAANAANANAASSAVDSTISGGGAAAASTFASDAAMVADALALGYDEWEVARRSTTFAACEAEESPRKLTPQPQPGLHSRREPPAGGLAAGDASTMATAEYVSYSSADPVDGWYHQGQSSWQAPEAGRLSYGWSAIEALVQHGQAVQAHPSMHASAEDDFGSHGFSICSPLPSASSPVHRTSAAASQQLQGSRSRPPVSRPAGRVACPHSRPPNPSVPTRAGIGPTIPERAAASPRRGYSDLLDEYMSSSGRGSWLPPQQLPNVKAGSPARPTRGVDSVRHRSPARW